MLKLSPPFSPFEIFLSGFLLWELTAALAFDAFALEEKTKGDVIISKHCLYTQQQQLFLHITVHILIKRALSIHFHIETAS